MSNKDVVTNEYSLLFGDCLERMKEIPVVKEVDNYES